MSFSRQMPVSRCAVQGRCRRRCTDALRVRAMASVTASTRKRRTALPSMISNRVSGDLDDPARCAAMSTTVTMRPRGCAHRIRRAAHRAPGSPRPPSPPPAPAVHRCRRRHRPRELVTETVSAASDWSFFHHLYGCSLCGIMNVQDSSFPFIIEVS